MPEKKIINQGSKQENTALRNEIKSLNKKMDALEKKMKTAELSAKKPKVKRIPSPYNNFIKEVMPLLRKKYPTKNQTELMPIAATLWREQKENPRKKIRV